MFPDDAGPATEMAFPMEKGADTRAFFLSAQRLVQRQILTCSVSARCIGVPALQP